MQGLRPAVFSWQEQRAQPLGGLRGLSNPGVSGMRVVHEQAVRQLRYLAKPLAGLEQQHVAINGEFA